jgi:hypothetical protein
VLGSHSSMSRSNYDNSFSLRISGMERKLGWDTSCSKYTTSGKGFSGIRLFQLASVFRNLPNCSPIMTAWTNLEDMVSVEIIFLNRYLFSNLKREVRCHLVIYSVARFCIISRLLVNIASSSTAGLPKFNFVRRW